MCSVERCFEFALRRSRREHQLRISAERFLLGSIGTYYSGERLVSGTRVSTKRGTLRSCSACVCLRANSQVTPAIAALTCRDRGTLEVGLRSIACSPERAAKMPSDSLTRSSIIEINVPELMRTYLLAALLAAASAAELAGNARQRHACASAARRAEGLLAASLALVRRPQRHRAAQRTRSLLS